MRSTALLSAAALVFTTLDAVQATAAASDADRSSDPAKVVSRPDLVSAVVSARAQGSRVEVESLRTETSSTWAEPNGLMTTQQHAGEVRFKDASGQWRDVDLTLREGVDGTIAPGGHKFDLAFGRANPRSGGVFATITAGRGSGRQVEWLSPWALPKPTLDGTKATYADVQPGVDLVLDARRSGFEQDFVLKTRPTTAPVWRILLRTKGLTAKPQPDGTIDFVDAKGQTQSSIPVPFMWDAAIDSRSGDPVNRARVAVSVEQQSSGQATLVIAPDANWILDPARQFPVTVDPTYATGQAFASFDTWVQTGVTTDQSASPELRVGSEGSVTTRSYLNFPTAPFKNKQILGATLSLFESYSASCTPSSFDARSASTASTSTRWTAQPTIGQVYGSTSVARGFSAGCPASRVAVQVTDLVKAWSTAAYATGGLALWATNEADANSWKKFHSSEGAGLPFISYSWNRAPAVPATPTFHSAVSYAPPGGSSALYTAYRRPFVQSKGSDADGNNIRYVFEFHTSTTTSASTLKATCSSASYPSGTEAGCAPGVDLPENTTIYVRAKSTDGFLDSAWSGWTTVRVGTQTPAAPLVTCPAPYSNGSWNDTMPSGNVTCTITATGTSWSAPGYVRATVDGKPYATNFVGGASGQIKINPSSDPAVAKTTVTLPNTAGLHTIAVQAESPAGRLSGTTNYGFGYGSTGLTSPAADPRTTTTGAVRITAAGPPKGSSSTPTAKVRWRTSGYGTTSETVGWNDATSAQLTLTDNGAAGISVTGTWDTAAETQDAQLDADPNASGVQPTALNERLPVLLDMQVCLTYSTATQCTWSQQKIAVQRVPHAFGGGFPTADAGPGQVALWTGEFNADETDVSVPGYNGELSLSRSHATYAGATNAMNGVFGPGWTAHLDGTDVGIAGVQIVDSTRVDGTLALLDGDGSTLVYGTPSGERRTTASFETGIWEPVDEDTALNPAKLKIDGTGASTTISYIEDDGTVTTFAVAAAPAATTDAMFRPVGIKEPGDASQTTYSYDGAGRVSRILAPVPPGVTCPATGALNPGCRALRLEYGTTGSATGRLTAAWLDIYNPDKAGGAGMDAIKVGTYGYDSAGRLTSATDPRSNLTTAYGYDADNRLTSIQPAGQVPFQLHYVSVDGRAKLSAVKRDRPAGDPAGGTSTLASFVYDVPPTGSGLPDLSEGAVQRWGQKAIPAKGYAVFGPDHPVSSTDPAQLAADDWQYADLQYTDANGYTINSAAYGAGDWQYTSTDYDQKGNVVRTLDERALRLIVDDQVPAGASSDQLATLTSYNADIKNASGDVVTPSGSLITDTFSPARFATLSDGTERWIRTHKKLVHDEGAPNQGIHPDTEQPYRLQTSETAYVLDPGTGQDLHATARTFSRYEAISSGDADGWALGLPSKVTTDVDLDGTISTGDITKTTRYDAEGGVVETRQPKSNGADAGTTKIVYYTAQANATHPECGGKPQWAALECKHYPAAAPASEPGQPATPTLPTVTTTRFSYLLAPTEVVEVSGSATRTTTTTYLTDGRTASTSVVTSGLAGSIPVTKKETTYDVATGVPTTVTAKNADGSVASSVVTGYDTWVRPTTYQATGDPATTTTYNAAGSVDVVTDASGTTRYSYDGTDGAGRTERRGLLTRVEVSSGASTWTSSAAYDADAELAVQKLPGGITQFVDRNHVGEQVSLRYTGQITTVDGNGTTTVEPDRGWLGWSVGGDEAGRIGRVWTPEGAAFTGLTGEDPGDAVPYDRAYSYDPGGRLTEVRDRTAAASGVDITDPAQQPACITRRYGFDTNDNRLTKATAASAPDGTCSLAGASTTTRTFDTADRPTSGANGSGTYAYDPFGRTRQLPASDAPAPALGDVSLTYFDDDLAHSISQGGTTSTFTLDAMDRRVQEVVTNGSEASTVTRHYNDVTDNPAWVTDGTSLQRYLELAGDSLSLRVDGAGNGSLMVADPFGSIVTTIDLPPAGTPATTIGGWDDFDEYGIPSDDAAIDTGLVRYGWLGAMQRAESSADLVLMGSRLYNRNTGLFTSTDPVAGGNNNAYIYPTDPVNESDINGEQIKPERGVGSIYGGVTTKCCDYPPKGSSVRRSTYYTPRISQRDLRRRKRDFARTTHGKSSNQKGAIGLVKNRITQSTQKIRIAGRTRIPDYYNGSKRVIGEVKYYRPGRTLRATKQIRDMARWAHKHKYKFVLKVNKGVRLSPYLQQMARDGRVKISRY